MFKCNCGKEYKTEKGLTKHKVDCPYKDIDLKKIYRLGFLIAEVDKNLFFVPLGKIKKKAKDENISFDESKKELIKLAIYKYRKSLWDILSVWQCELLTSEYRSFLKWIWKTYKEITLISLRNMLSNTKIIFRYNFEHTASMIGTRIDDSLIYIHEHGDFCNNFEFVNAVMAGQISMYYVLFNDWLATYWFGNLEIDLQHELNDSLDIASKTVLERLKKEEFDLLQELACIDTPKIFELDI